MHSCMCQRQILVFIYHQEVKICRGPMQLFVAHMRWSFEVTLIHAQPPLPSYCSNPVTAIQANNPNSLRTFRAGAHVSDAQLHVSATNFSLYLSSRSENLSWIDATIPNSHALELRSHADSHPAASPLVLQQSYSSDTGQIPDLLERSEPERT